MTLKTKTIFHVLTTVVMLLIGVNAHAMTTKFAVGYDHVVTIRSDGTLWAWGNNSYGQLGDGTFEDKSTPVRIGTEDQWVLAAAGYQHTVAIKIDGTLWAWGNNSYGNLGDGTFDNKNVPVQIGADNQWIALSAGYAHTVGLKRDGTLWAWGDNSSGQLGDGSQESKNVPVQIGSGKQWVYIAAGSEHTMAIKSDGTLWAWGNNNQGKLGDGTTDNKLTPVKIGTDDRWIMVTAGGSHTIALKRDGTLWAWGDNYQSKLGLGTSGGMELSPVQVGVEGQWAAIAAGGDHTIARKLDGTIWTWGANYAGQLGIGITVDMCSPVQVGTESQWVAIAAGIYNTAALKPDGSLWLWGHNGSGQLGNGTVGNKLVPTQTGGDGQWLHVSSGTYHAAAIRSDGTLWAWGNNSYGQLGDGTFIRKQFPVQIGAPYQWTAVSAGNLHTLAIRSDGTLWAWGSNYMGQLGDGTRAYRILPVQIGTDNRWIAVAAGTYHSAAIKSDGSLWAWGWNVYGQLGDGTKTDRTSPVQIGSGSLWSKVSVGSIHTAAIKSDGTLWTWGNNNDGQLGDGSIEETIPTQVGIGYQWSDVAGGDFHTSAIRSDGTLWAWGWNVYGQIGVGPLYQQYNSPVQVSADNTWASLTTCDSSVMALKADGTLWAWGYNGGGQLGDGTKISRPAPAEIGAGTQWTSASLGAEFASAISGDGMPWAWGVNDSGQLGDGTAWKEAPQFVMNLGNFSDLPDITPFSFIDLSSAPLNTMIYSNAITIFGIADPVSIMISGGEYEINLSGSWASAPGTIYHRDTVRVRHTSSFGLATATESILSINGVSEPFRVTTTTGPASSATLAADSASPQVAGVPLTFTAAGQGGTGLYDYKFWLRRSETATWTMVQDYSSSNAWTWDTAGYAGGLYYVRVFARSSGSTAAYEAQKTLSYMILETSPATGAILVASPVSPQLIGAPVAITAYGQGGTGTYEYKFLLKSLGTTTWTTMQDYSSLNTWSWDTSGSPAGTYHVMVYARNAGSPAFYEVARSMAYSIAWVPPARSLDLVSDRQSPVQRGTVWFRATSTGGTGNYEYKFLVKSATGAWTVMRDYQPDGNLWWDTWDMNQWPAGKYTIQVMARSVGSGTDYDVLKNMDFIISDTMPATSVNLESDPSSPAQRGGVLLTATAQGGYGAYEYKFLVKSATGAWTIMRDYQSYGQLVWETGDMNQWPAGKYTIQVMARSVGSGTDYDVLKNMDFSISDTMPATSVNLESDPSSPAQRGGVLLTATAQGGYGAYEYKFLVKSATGAWTIMRDYQSYGQLVWETGDMNQWPAGKYTIQVMARSAGSGTEYDVLKSMDFIISNTMPATSVNLESDPSSPAQRGGVLLTATAQGGYGAYEYKFLVKSATGAWTIMRDYQSYGQLVWETGDMNQWPAGKYTIQVMARSAGSGTEYDVLKSMDFIISNTMPATSVNLESDPSSPAQRGGVLLTATAQGGYGAYEYKFLVKSATGAWTIMRDYQSYGQLVWETGDMNQWPAGKYTIQVMARSAGSGTEYDVLKSMDFIISNTMPATGVSLTADKTSPIRRDTVSFTAAAQGGFGTYEYKFLVKSASGTWTVLRDYQNTSFLLWDTWSMGQWPAGKYTIQVMARSIGSGTEYDVLKNMDFIISDTLPATGVSLTADKTSPLRRDTVWFTATAQGGFGVYEYKFLVKSASGAWTVLRDYYQDGNCWWDAWDTYQWPAGKYTIQVMARSMGSSTEYDVLKNMDFIISNTMPATAVSLTADKTSPAQRQTIMFTASAQGGTGNYEYKFLVKNNAMGSWTVVLDYWMGGNGIWYWNAGDGYQWPAGNYTIQVMARSIGSGTEYDVVEDMDFIISDTIPATGVSLIADKTSPAQRRTIMFTASAQGGTGNYEYKFLVKNNAMGSWIVVQDYWMGGNGPWYWNAGDVYQWPAGTYTIQVMARSVGSNTEYDTFKNLAFTIVNDDPVSAVSLVVSNGIKSPAVLGTVGTVQFTAAATGTTGNYEYQFRVKNNAGTVWTTLREYAALDTIDWTPSQAGSYTIQVRARNSGSIAAYEAARSIIFDVVTDSPVTAVSLIADKTSPQTVGAAATVTFTALATGTTNNYEYQFMVKNSIDNVWTTAQNWGSSGSFPWKPGAAGTYTIQVRARNVGSLAGYEAYRSKAFSITE